MLPGYVNVRSLQSVRAKVSDETYVYWYFLLVCLTTDML